MDSFVLNPLLPTGYEDAPGSLPFADILDPGVCENDGASYQRTKKQKIMDGAAAFVSPSSLVRSCSSGVASDGPAPFALALGSPPLGPSLAGLRSDSTALSPFLAGLDAPSELRVSESFMPGLDLPAAAVDDEHRGLPMAHEFEEDGDGGAFFADHPDDVDSGSGAPHDDGDAVSEARAPNDASCVNDDDMSVDGSRATGDAPSPAAGPRPSPSSPRSPCTSSTASTVAGGISTPATSAAAAPSLATGSPARVRGGRPAPVRAGPTTGSSFGGVGATAAAAAGAGAGAAGGAGSEKNRQLRLERNRLSAQQSRDRKKAEFKQKDELIHKLTRQNEDLQRRLAELEAMVSSMGGSGVADATASYSSSGSAASAAASPLSPPAGDETDDARSAQVAVQSSPPRKILVSRRAGSASGNAGESARPVGMVLFALVMSLGVFYGLVGMSPAVEESSLKRLPADVSVPEHAFRGRVLLNLASSADSDSNAGESDPETDASTDTEMTAEHAPVASVSAAASAQPNKESQLEVMNHAHLKEFSARLQELLLPAPSSKSVVPARTDRPVNRLAVSAATQRVQSNVTDVYADNQKMIRDGLQRALAHYQKMWPKAENGTSRAAPSSILFCPAPIHLVHRPDDGPQAESQEQPPSGRRTGDEMLLWVPSGSLAAEWDYVHHGAASGTPNTPAPRSVLTEMSVKVGDVRKLPV